MRWHESAVFLVLLVFRAAGFALEARWFADGTSNDNSGSGNHMQGLGYTALVDPWANWDVVQFDGNASSCAYVNSTPGAFDLGEPTTVSFWLKAEDQPSYQSVVAWSTAGAERIGLGIYREGPRTNLAIYEMSGIWGTHRSHIFPDVGASQWNHFVLYFDPTVSLMSVWFNGDLKNDSISVPVFSTTSFSVGCNFKNGVIDTSYNMVPGSFIYDLSYHTGDYPCLTSDYFYYDTKCHWFGNIGSYDPINCAPGEVVSIHSPWDDLIYSRSNINTHFWIGLVRNSSSLAWNWTDGTPFDYSTLWCGDKKHRSSDWEHSGVWCDGVGNKQPDSLNQFCSRYDYSLGPGLLDKTCSESRAHLCYTQVELSTPAPDTFAPDTLAPNTSAPDTLAPDTLAPDTLAPNTSAPDTLAPNTSAPDTFAPDTLAPNTSAPDTLAPDTLAPDTLAPNTSAPDTLAPNTSAPDTFAPDTLAPNTSAPDTFAPDTLAPNTSAPDTLAPNTSAPGTLAPDTLAPNTSAPDTFAPDTLAPNTSAPDTLAPNTSAPDTLIPDTLAPNTSAPDTLVPDTLAPDTIAPDTSAPDTLAPNTSAPDTFVPDTLAPNTSAPDTLAPNSSAPDTLAPDTIAPDTSAPNTSVPDTLAPNTSAPDTFVPSTSAPDTPAPDTFVPTTSAPDTLVPETLAPNTSAPDTPAPYTPAPDTLAPNTSAPDTPAPDTLAPDTLVPNTSAPDTLVPETLAPNTSTPDTLAPITLLPSTSAPNTLVPLTGVPGTFSPLTPQPTTAAPTALPTQAPKEDAVLPSPTPEPGKVIPASEKKVVQGGASAATATNPSGAKLAAVIGMDCEVEDIDLGGGEPLDWEFHPLGFGIGDHKQKYFLGAVVSNLVIVIVFFVLNYAIAWVQVACLKVPLPTAVFYVRAPGLVYIPMLWLLMGTSIAASNLAFFPSRAPSWVAAVGVAVLLLCLSLPAIMWWTLLRKAKFQATTVPDPKINENAAHIVKGFGKGADGADDEKEATVYTGWKRTAYVLVFGSEVWVRNDGAPDYFVEQYGLFFEQYRNNFHWFSLVEMVQILALALSSAWKPRNHGMCMFRNILITIVLFVFFAMIVTLRPYNSMLDMITASAMSGLMFAAVLLMAIAIGVGGSSMLMTWAAYLLLLTALLMMFKGAYDLILYCLDVKIGRRWDAVRAARAGNVEKWKGKTETLEMSLLGSSDATSSADEGSVSWAGPGAATYQLSNSAPNMVEMPTARSQLDLSHLQTFASRPVGCSPGNRTNLSQTAVLPKKTNYAKIVSI